MRQGGMQPAHSLRRTHHRGLPACGTNNSRRLKEAKAVIKDLSAWLDFPELRVVNGQLVASTKIIPKPSVMRQQILRGSLLLHPTNLLLGEACLDYCDWLRNTHNDHSPDYLSSSASFLRYSRSASAAWPIVEARLVSMASSSPCLQVPFRQVRFDGTEPVHGHCSGPCQAQGVQGSADLHGL
ncbi:hypothetical protein RvY_18119-2 [Ramazzottius varieornatus]|uniref:Uncharacterized protein n=1 Tax=Ramazzottius varieornatus TaxID=947166 RepID=A0A1D1W4L3_RAMVA|nr:hypothetical protein RvY_18119-2 [Ramazzottius varieornatus]